MNLIRKIKNCKRYRANKHLKESAEYIRWFAESNITKYNGDKIFVINPLMYEVIRFNNNVVPNNIKQSPLIGITEFIITVRTLKDYENEQNKWLKEWCGIPNIKDYPPSQETVDKLSCIPLSKFAQPELYIGKPLGYGVDKTIFTTSPIPPK